MKEDTLAILVGGGPAPGINGVIASATIEAANSGLRVLGLYDGYRHIARGDTSHVTELAIDDVSRILSSPGDEKALRAAWEGWHTIAPPMRKDYQRFVELSNKGATELGFDDLKVRHAISLAIDREGLVQAAVGGHGRGTWGPLPEWDPMYEAAVDAGRKKDAVQADRLLNEAGWVRSAGGVREKAGQRLEFECVIQDDDVHRRLGYALAGQLGHIGISLLPRPVQPFKEFYSAVEAGPASFINKWLWQDAMDAIIGFSASWCRPFPNAQKSSVPELDAAYHAWVRATSHQEMKEAASRAQHVVADRLPYIPLLTPDDVWVVDRRVHGYQPYPATLYPFYHSVWIEH